MQDSGAPAPKYLLSILDTNGKEDNTMAITVKDIQEKVFPTQAMNGYVGAGG